jgi:elongation factor G
MRVEPWFEGLPNPEGLNLRNKEEINLDWGGKLVFCNCIVGGVIDARFLPSILKGVMEKMQNGPLAGYYVRDVQVSVYDGKMHDVDSNDISFKIAGMHAFRQAFLEAGPQLLEPIYTVEVLCPDEMVGAVMGDLQSRMGLVEGMEAEGHFQKVTARAPLAQLNQYSSALRSLTGGRARYKMYFHDYAPVAREIQTKLAEAYSRHEVMQGVKDSFCKVIRLEVSSYKARNTWSTSGISYSFYIAYVIYLSSNLIIYFVATSWMVNLQLSYCS